MAHFAKSALRLALAGLLAVGTGCSKNQAPDSSIRIDGSSTVFPITQAVAEEFEKKNDVEITVGVSGSGGGFKKLCRGETMVNDASRPIQASEVEACEEQGVEFIELPVAYDGIAVVVHRENDWAREMTVEDLEKMWKPSAEDKITRWNQVRSEWPAQPLHLFGPGVASGTYDYFTEAILGEEGKSRGDFNSNENDNVLVRGVATDENAIGFFGYAYYAENTDRLTAVAIDDGDSANGEGPISPSAESVSSGTYQPLSRPLFIYVSKKAAEQRAVSAFVEYYLGEGSPLVGKVGYVPLPDRALELARKRFEDRVTGTLFEGGAQVGVTVEQLLSGS